MLGAFPLPLLDKVLIHNISKDKKIPGTKAQPKYFGPYDVENVTKGHVFVSKSDKSKKSPFTSLRSIYDVFQRHPYDDSFYSILK